MEHVLIVIATAAANVIHHVFTWPVTPPVPGKH